MVMISIACGSRRRRKTRSPLPLKPGDRVMRKSDRDRRVAVGVVERVGNVRAQIRWPAPTRIGGEFHHSSMRLDSPDLMVATEEAIAERVVGVRLSALKQQMSYALRFCPKGLIDDSGWFERNRTTPDKYFEELCARTREKAKALWQAGRELDELRARLAKEEAERGREVEVRSC
jgi:hypothetical protein